MPQKKKESGKKAIFPTSFSAISFCCNNRQFPGYCLCCSALNGAFYRFCSLFVCACVCVYVNRHMCFLHFFLSSFLLTCLHASYYLLYYTISTRVGGCFLISASVSLSKVMMPLQPDALRGLSMHSENQVSLCAYFRTFAHS